MQPTERTDPPMGDKCRDLAQELLDSLDRAKSQRRDFGTSENPMTEAEWRAAPRSGVDGSVDRAERLSWGYRGE